MMEYLDLVLVAVAGFLVWKVHTEEMMLLFTYFSISSVIAVALSLAGLFDSLGAIWFAMYSMWLAYFTTTTKNRYIARLYLCQQIMCILIVLQWKSDYSFLYEYFEYLVAILYVMQLGCEYGNHHRRRSNQRGNRNINMAHREA